jgi:hypothetical protein
LPDLPSIGDLFERIDKVRALASQASEKTTEFYEQEIATQVKDLADVVADIVYLHREHLSCHDCKVADHTHHDREGRVRLVYSTIAQVHHD